jgi:TonB family protein
MAALTVQLELWTRLHSVSRAEYLWGELSRLNGIELLRDPEIVMGEQKLLEHLQNHRLDAALTEVRALQPLYMSKRDAAAARAAEVLGNAVRDVPAIPRRIPCGPPVTQLAEGADPKRIPGIAEDQWMPPLAERYLETGTVMLRIHVSDTGCVLDTAIQISSGSPLLDNRAIDHIEASSYHPAQADGHAIESYTLARLDFRWDD